MRRMYCITCRISKLRDGWIKLNYGKTLCIRRISRIRRTPTLAKSYKPNMGSESPQGKPAYKVHSDFGNII